MDQRIVDSIEIWRLGGARLRESLGQLEQHQEKMEDLFARLPVDRHGRRMGEPDDEALHEIFVLDLAPLEEMCEELNGLVGRLEALRDADPKGEGP